MQNKPIWQAKLGRGIRAAREKEGLTQQQLAERLGFKDAESIRLFESGFKAPKMDVSRRIVMTLKADISFDGCRIHRDTFPVMQITPPESVPEYKTSFDFHHQLTYRGATVE